MKKIILIIFILTPFLLSAQTNSKDTINLFECYKALEENYPLIKQKGLYESSYLLNYSNHNKTLYPQIFLNGQASYQSDVTKIEIPLPGISIPVIANDMYKINIDVNQIIFDGGSASKLKDIEDVSYQINNQNIDVEINKIKEIINRYFFNIILLQENQNLLTIQKNELLSKLSKTEAAVKNNIAIQTNADILKAEVIRIEQQLSDIEYSVQAYCSSLGVLLNINLSPWSYYNLPEINTDTMKYQNNRPELKLFDLQMEKAELSKKLYSLKQVPKFYVFAQAGYGRPGLNMLNPDFNGWFIGGVRLSWNICDWGQTKNNKIIAGLQKEIIGIQKETFQKNIDVQLQKEYSDIEKFTAFINKDEELINLRESIVSTTSIQLDNGIITATEYTTELNLLSQARLNKLIHKLQLKMAIINLLYLSGNY